MPSKMPSQPSNAGKDPQTKAKSEKLFFVKVHSHGADVVVAVCDRELLGKNFTEGDFVLEIREEFYGGKLATFDEVYELMRTATIVNVIGEKIVGELVRRKIIEEEALIHICGIPHVQIITV